VRELMQRAPAVLGVVVLAASAYVASVRAPDLSRALIGLAYLAVLFLIAAHDVRTRRAPNRIVYPALAFAIAASLLLGPEIAAEAIGGGGVAFVLFLALAFIGRGAMGLGDVKVAALCGIAVGLHGLAWLIAWTFILGLVVCTPLVLLRVNRLKDTIAFTPFLAAGTAVCLWLGYSYLW
jgi:leader peptidase (prepilin peptidase)/N-methyltransferase